MDFNFQTTFHTTTPNDPRKEQNLASVAKNAAASIANPLK